jgi:predicted  nucleic acid-binding Zn-ribbon protein
MWHSTGDSEITSMAEDIVLEHLKRIQNSLHDLRNQVADTNTAIAAVRSDLDSFRNETRREFARIETRLDHFEERLLRIERNAGVVA